MIKSGAVIQNKYLNNPYPTNYNPLARPGNFDVARPHDASSVFDTGMPKDVSPYQPRVTEYTSFQPKSVFRAGKLQRQIKEKNTAKWGQTALKSVFGADENAVTNYMAQRLLGLVDGQKTPTVPDQPTLPSQPTMSAEPAQPGSIFDLGLGEAPLKTVLTVPSAQSIDEPVLDSVAVVETQPMVATDLLGITQETEAGEATVSPRFRFFPDSFF